MNELEEAPDKWAKREHHAGKGFIRDGIIDFTRWSKAQRRILLLLKEVYGEGTDWDLRETIREKWQGPKNNIWWNAGYWCYATQNSEPFTPGFPSNDGARMALLSSGAVISKKATVNQARLTKTFRIMRNATAIF